MSLFTSLCPTVPCSVLPSFDSKKEPAFLSTSNASVAMSCAHKKDRPPGKLFRELLQLHPLTLVFFSYKNPKREKKNSRVARLARIFFSVRVHNAAFLKKYCYRGRSFRKTFSLCYSSKNKKKAERTERIPPLSLSLPRSPSSSLRPCPS